MLEAEGDGLSMAGCTDDGLGARDGPADESGTCRLEVNGSMKHGCLDGVVERKVLVARKTW